MSAIANPAQAAFVASLGREFVFCQILICRAPPGFLLRHVHDAAASAETLRPLQPRDLRALAQTTAAGAFRPLKSAPNLRAGWQLAARAEETLVDFINILYPGAIADWFAAQSPSPPVTNYREFAARQTGMYRVAAALPPEPAQAAVAACCHEDFCLKRRLWTVEGLAPDSPARKSVIPCLEPCAVMLEFARKAARWEQGIDAPDAADEPRPSTETAAECDFDSPANPRRRRFVLEKQRRAVTSAI